LLNAIQSLVDRDLRTRNKQEMHKAWNRQSGVKPAVPGQYRNGSRSKSPRRQRSRSPGGRRDRSRDGDRRHRSRSGSRDRDRRKGSRDRIRSGSGDRRRKGSRSHSPAAPGKPRSFSPRSLSGICYAFQKGECKNGDKCKYSHDKPSKDRAKDRCRSPSPASKKQMLCRFHKAGTCKKGNQCDYSHDKSLETAPAPAPTEEGGRGNSPAPRRDEDESEF